MSEIATPPNRYEMPKLVSILSWYAIFGCAVFCISILIADWTVPNHDAIADTISDLAAGEQEYIVDIGLYIFSSSLIATALACAHVHLGGWRWSVGTVCYALLGLIVFLVGSRNEYGDNDSDGWIFHIYLVYALGLLMAIIPWSLSKGAETVSSSHRRILLGISLLWIISAPIFFFLPTEIDGIYERYLGILAIASVCTMAHLFLKRRSHQK